MAKEKKEDKVEGTGLATALAEINKKHGAGTAQAYGDMEPIKVDSFPSGSIGLDYALGVGGYPRGRIIELWGGYSSGKTTMTLHAIAEMQALGGTCGFVDAEHALDMKYAAAVGVDVDSLILSQPDNGEQAIEIVETLARSGEVALIVVDSVAALVPKAEIEGEMGHHIPGAQAKLMSQALRKLTGLCARTNTTVMFINQTRNKIGVMYGSPVTTPGGDALKFWASVRMEVARTGTMKEGDVSLGSETRVKVLKNKVAPPFREAEFEIIYGKGINKEQELVTAGVALKLVDKAGSWYSYKGEKLGQGADSVLVYLKEHPEMAEEIKNAVQKEWFKR